MACPKMAHNVTGLAEVVGKKEPSLSLSTKVNK
jgi:hypothetical protein